MNFKKKLEERNIFLRKRTYSSKNKFKRSLTYCDNDTDQDSGHCAINFLIILIFYSMEKFEFVRFGTSFQVLKKNFDELDVFIKENPTFKPIKYFQEERFAYVTEDISDKDLNFEVECSCIMCNEQTIIKVREEDFYMRQRDRVKIQDAFPYLKSEKRECLATGYCFKCQKQLFSKNYL